MEKLEPGPQSGTWPCQLLMRWRHLVNLVNGLKQLGMDLLAGRGGEGAGSQVAPWTQVNGKPVLPRSLYYLLNKNRDPWTQVMFKFKFKLPPGHKSMASLF